MDVDGGVETELENDGVDVARVECGGFEDEGEGEVIEGARAREAAWSARWQMMALYCRGRCRWGWGNEGARRRRNGWCRG